MSNTKKSNQRVCIVIGLVLFSTVLAICKVYPSNYESLFTPINYGLYGLIWMAVLISIGCLFSKKTIPGTAEVSTISFIHMMTTLGLACGYFSYVIDPSFISVYGEPDPYKHIINWYGPFQWCIFVPFLLIEIYEMNHRFPKWLEVIKRYTYAISMMLAIGISLMAGCNSIPKIIYSLCGFTISPYLLMLPICILVSISLIRGINKGMRLFSNLTMILMYVVTFSLIILGLSKTLPVNVSKEIASTYSQFITLNIYTGSEFQIKCHAPYLIWAITWVPILSPFARRIGQGRKLRDVVLMMVLGPSLICALYTAIGKEVFADSNGIQLLSHYTVLSIIYVVMLILMFTTSADSTSYSLDESISRGAKAPVAYRKLIWVIIMCSFISVLMIAGNGSADALYGISYITAPLIVVLGLVMGGIMIYRKFKGKKYEELNYTSCSPIKRNFC